MENFHGKKVIADLHAKGSFTYYIMHRGFLKFLHSISKLLIVNTNFDIRGEEVKFAIFRVT